MEIDQWLRSFQVNPINQCLLIGKVAQRSITTSLSPSGPTPTLHHQLVCHLQVFLVAVEIWMWRRGRRGRGEMSDRERKERMRMRMIHPKTLLQSSKSSHWRSCNLQMFDKWQNTWRLIFFWSTNWLMFVHFVRSSLQFDSNRVEIRPLNSSKCSRPKFILIVDRSGNWSPWIR